MVSFKALTIKIARDNMYVSNRKSGTLIKKGMIKKESKAQERRCMLREKEWEGELKKGD